MKWSGGTPCRAEWSFLTRFWYGEDWPPLFDWWDGMGARLRKASRQRSLGLGFLWNLAR